MAARPAIRSPDVWRLGLSIMLLLLIEASGPARAALANDPAVAFQRRPDGLQVTIGGRPFARYIFATEAIIQPFFEAIHAPDGTLVTRNNPPVEGVDLADHPTYHPGLWQAFGDLNGADSWRNKDRIRHAGFVEEPQGGPGRGTFVVRNRHEKGDRIIGEEVCRITVLVRPVGHLIVWDSGFQPVGGDLVFGDQEEMGLGMRVATPLAVVKAGRITDSEGRVNEAQVWGKQADWCAYDRVVGSQRVGVLLMADPGNFRCSWFHARDYGLLVANRFGRNAFTRGEKSRVIVKKGDTLRLRFGVLIWGGRPDLGVAYREFLKQVGRNPRIQESRSGELVPRGR